MGGREKRSLITGVCGMDGANLSNYLLGLGYVVYGLKRRTSSDNMWRLRHLDILDHPNFHIVEADITDLYSVIECVKNTDPDEVYNLAAQSQVGTSFDQPELTWNVTAQGAINVLNACILHNKNIKFYQASSSETMGSNYDIIDGKKVQNENTKMSGNSPYGVAKLAAYNYMRIMREGRGYFICSGILYNHSSPLRTEYFFERKVTKYIGELYNWLDGAVEFSDETIRRSDGETFPKLRLGDLSTYRDMGHSVDYVRAMHAMLQQSSPDDYVVCTGTTFQMSDIVKIAFRHIGIENWEDYVYIDKSLFRPREVEYLRGDCTKAKNKLGWFPRYNLYDMISEMVDQDIKWAKEKSKVLV